MNAIEQQVTTALNGLGTTSRGIADTLANKGVKGYRNCTDVCVDLPARDFIQAFDRGEFPELEAS